MHTQYRILVGIVAVGLLLPLCASARAGDEAPHGLGARHLDLLPLNELERYELARDHPKVAKRLHILKNRVVTLRKRLAARSDPADAGARQLATQIAATNSELAPLLATLLAKMENDAVDDALLAHIATAPTGPLGQARYAQSLVLYVGGLPPNVRAAFEHLVPRVDGALVALARQKVRLYETLEQLDVDKELARTIGANHDQAVRAIEKRFWRLVDYLVPEARRAAIHRVLPGAYQKVENVVAHLYGLPDLSASQGVRLRALLTEIEAESAPDSAQVRRLQRRSQEGKLSKSERAALQEGIQAAQYRMLDLQRYAVTAAREILTPRQWTALEAIPPRVSPNDRKQHSGQVLEGVALDPGQREKLKAMRAELAHARREFRERRLAAAARGAAYGPDSPQMMDMMMAMARVEAAGNAVQRAFNARVFLEVLTPEQVTRWVLEPR